MAAACSDTTHRRIHFPKWLARRLTSSPSEDGQALVLTVLAMTVLLVMCAASIDLSTWYQKHHQAQVSADAAALAAASCLAHSNTGQTNPNAINCTSTTDTTDAKSVADSISTTNLPNANDQVTINTAKGTVTVVASAQPQVDFAGIVGVHPTVSARSTASYTGQGANFSIFVGNDLCANGNNGNGVPSNTGLQIASNGGGNANVNGLYSDGLLDNHDNSGTASYSGGISDGQSNDGYNTGQTPLCGSSGDGKTDSPGPTGGTGNSWNPTNANTSLQSDEALPYPEQYTEPQLVPGVTITGTEPSSPPTIVPGDCTFASTYFSTDATGIHQISYPGIYCVTNAAGTALATSYDGYPSTSCTAGPGNSSQSSTDRSAGSIYINSTLEGSGGFEFVGPCVVGDKNLSGSAPVINSTTPLIYGTAGDTSTCLQPNGMVNPSQVVSAYDNVYLYNNNLTLNGTIYAPCGTVELSKNNDFAAFIEAGNASLDQNNFTSFVGTGPPSAPALDGLTS
jgi:Flp pilus assembly protein TadG